jgi:hypothetical protein
MANIWRGEASFVVKGETYNLVLDTNSVCEIEELTNEGFLSLSMALNDINRIKISYIRAILWGALRANHAEVSLSQAGQLLSQAGLADTIAALHKLMERAFPKPEKLEAIESANGSRPPKPQRRGTG